jgi:hypothetical protein
MKKGNIPFVIGVAVITNQATELPLFYLPTGELLGTIKGKVKLVKRNARQKIGINSEMRTLESLTKELTKLRKEHTAFYQYERWNKMEAAGKKIRRILDQLTEHYPEWRETTKSEWKETTTKGKQ